MIMHLFTILSEQFIHKIKQYCYVNYEIHEKFLKFLIQWRIFQ